MGTYNNQFRSLEVHTSVFGKASLQHLSAWTLTVCVYVILLEINKTEKLLKPKRCTGYSADCDQRKTEFQQAL